MLRRAPHKPEHNWGRVGSPGRSTRWPCENLRHYGAKDRNALEGKRYELLRCQWRMPAPTRYRSPAKLPSTTWRPLQQFLSERRKYLLVGDRTFAARAELRLQR